MQGWRAKRRDRGSQKAQDMLGEPAYFGASILVLEPLRDIRNSKVKLEMDVGFRMWKALATGTRAPSKEFEQERGRM